MFVGSSSASWGSIYLLCDCRVPYDSQNRWVGIAMINYVHQKVGPVRKSIKAARRDAERLAVELLRDIRDGTKVLMEQYGMGEDD